MSIDKIIFFSDNLASDQSYINLIIVTLVLSILLNHMLSFPVMVGFLDGIIYQSCGFLAEAFNEWSKPLEQELKKIGLEKNRPRETLAWSTTQSIVAPTSETSKSEV